MKNLKEIRENKKLKQKEIAEKLGIDRSTYSKYETGDSEPSFDILFKIADILESSIDAILGYEPKKMTRVTKYTTKEKEIIKQYRNHPELQIAVDRVLNIKDIPDETIRISIPDTFTEQK